jgi:hypothetical protein
MGGGVGSRVLPSTGTGAESAFRDEMPTVVKLEEWVLAACPEESRGEVDDS